MPVDRFDGVKREGYAMVPRSIILGRLTPRDGERAEADDPKMLALYAYLDMRQGKQGRPARGYGYVARAMGWQARTVSRIAGLLAEAGLIALGGSEGPSHEQVTMTVLHNPARGRYVPGLELQPRRPKYRGSSTFVGGAVVRATRDSASTDARRTHQSVVHPTPDLGRAAHRDASPSASSNARRSRSTRSFEMFANGVLTSDQRRLLDDAFGPLEFVPPTDACRGCGKPADGAVTVDGAWCLQCEPF